MIEFKPKLWTGAAGGLMMLGALSACGEKPKDGTATKTEDAAASADAANTAVVAGGEAGEGGAVLAYSSIPESSRLTLRLQHIKGFLLVGQKVAKSADGTEGAAIVIGQGLSEALDPQEPKLAAAGLDVAAVRKAAETGSEADIKAAIAAIDAAYAKNPGVAKDTAIGMAELTQGLYAEVLKEGIIDPTEYLHSQGAALSLKDLVAREKSLAPIKADVDALAAYWPTTLAPEEAAKIVDKSKVVSSVSRIELSINSL
ncbi:hypothetical protein Q1W73_00125 [Asticcacaulis sp. ZE23SCel15]|uniref:hypothetical protein n=1 Tax=Asticcacaulis sp. ZE23SCel15 TaxID=3059027 RepID=UPI00265DA701|nr:hypothetical protein [Asticcacaulis sp. ZE23SCel15]WKL57430.1 hypothetical protein Q1W73_00125 [Asticcacaulis sp. ZE23SCel15]